MSRASGRTLRSTVNTTRNENPNNKYDGMANTPPVNSTFGWNKEPGVKLKTHDNTLYGKRIVLHPMI